jgi:hypothetical protein
VEDQLRQERTARQGAEGQLQQERTTLADARSALERERAAVETVQKLLAEREADVTRLDGELVALSITSADQELSLKEQSATVISLQQAVEAERRALEVEKKQVEGGSLFSFFVLLIFPLRVRSPSDFSCWCRLGLRTALGHATDRAEALQASYNSSEPELLDLRSAALETCQAVEEGEAQAGSSLASRLRALGGHVSGRMRRALRLGV